MQVPGPNYSHWSNIIQMNHVCSPGQALRKNDGVENLSHSEFFFSFLFFLSVDVVVFLFGVVVFHQKFWRREEKPSPLLELLIHRYCEPFGVVMDPYMGTGSSALAIINLMGAHKLAFKFYGCEMDVDLCRAAKIRLAQTWKARMGAESKS
jgi:hypothetical protein